MVCGGCAAKTPGIESGCWMLTLWWARTDSWATREVITTETVREVAIRSARRVRLGRTGVPGNELAAEGEDRIRQRVESAISVHVRAFQAQR